MKAIILAAGYGARMRPLTDSRPKALLEIAGETVIGRAVRSLVAHGISDVCVVTGYRRAELEAYLSGAFPHVRFTLVANEVYHQTNNIYSMHLAFERFPIDDDILLMESDVVFTDRALERLLEDEHANVALVDKFRVGMDGTVVSVDRGLITSIIPPHLQGAGFDFSDKYKTLNVYKFSREFARTSFRSLLSFYAKAYDDNCYYEAILGILVYMQHEQIFTCEVGGEDWCELDDPNDMRLAEMAFDADGRLDALDRTFGALWNVPVADFVFPRNQYFPPSSILADMRYNLPALLENYGSTQALLNEKLAHWLLVPAARVCLLNGLSQVYPMLEALVGRRRALVPEPTFGEYARVFHNRAVYRDEAQGALTVPPADAVAGADIVVFVNPNNPTGSWIPSEDIVALARREPQKLVLVDESFADFAGAPSVQDLLRDEPLPNVWVLKSLSKALGAPGLRLGYVYSADEGAITRLNAQMPIWNVNSLAEYFLEIVLKHRRAFVDSVAQTIVDREAFAVELARLGAVDRVYPSRGNYLLVRLRVPAAQVPALRRTLLIGRNLYVKDCSARFADGRGYLRIAVRRPEDNARLARALEAEVGHRP